MLNHVFLSVSLCQSTYGCKTCNNDLSVPVCCQIYVYSPVSAVDDGFCFGCFGELRMEKRWRKDGGKMEHRLVFGMLKSFGCFSLGDWRHFRCTRLCIQNIGSEGYSRESAIFQQNFSSNKETLPDSIRFWINKTQSFGAHW